VGNPETDTATVPLNELTPAAMTFTWGPAAPAPIVNDTGDKDRVKSGGGGGAEMVTAAMAE